MYKIITRGEKANIETLITTQFNGAQAAFWNVYEAIQFECRLFEPTTPPNSVSVFRLTTTYDPFHDILESALKKYTTERKLNTALLNCNS